LGSIISTETKIILTKEDYPMSKYNKITALYSRLSVGDEDRDGGESNSIQNQKKFLEEYARQNQMVNIRHYIDDDESGRFFDRSGYVQMMEDVESGKVGTCVMKDLTRWGRDYLQVGNAMETFRRNNVRFVAINHGIDSINPDSLEMAPFINIMSEWQAKDISKKVKTSIKTKGMSGKPIMTEAPYGYVKDPDSKDSWLVDGEAADVVRLIFGLFMDGNNRNQICIYLRENRITTPTFYLKEHDRGTAKSKDLSEANRCNWNKATVTRILTRQEYCGDVVNFKTTKHFKDKRNHYVDKENWHITENVHEPIVSRSTFENVQRILETAPVKRPNGDGYIHPLSGLLFCKDCGAKMHIRTIRKKEKRYMARCSEYAKGKAKGSKCATQHHIDCDALLQNIAGLLRKIAKYSLDNKAEFENMVKNSLALQQTDDTKKQQKRIPQITTRLAQIDRVINKLYEDNALGNIEQDRYQQLSQKYSEEYHALKKELEETQGRLSDQINTNQRAKKFIKLVESYCDFNEVTPTAINEFISKLVVHERDVKGARLFVQHVEVYFNHIGRFENELTETAEPTGQEYERMREEIEEAKREKIREYHRAYRKPYRERNLEKQREYERMKAREYRAKKKLQKESEPIAI
jgi:DNA invertase Pin-like site-specific DNA recombinase